MSWTIGVWFALGILIGLTMGRWVWRRQKSSESAKQIAEDEAASYQARIKKLEDALRKAEDLVHNKAQRLHEAESQRSALHAQFEVTHARMSQFRDLLSEATTKLKLEHNARRTAEEQVRGLDGLVRAVQAQLLRMENDKKQLSAELESSKQAIPTLGEVEMGWQQRALHLQTSVHELKQANEDLARQLAMAENKLMNRTYELRSAEEKIRTSQLATSGVH